MSPISPTPTSHLPLPLIHQPVINPVQCELELSLDRLSKERDTDYKEVEERKVRLQELKDKGADGADIRNAVSPTFDSHSHSHPHPHSSFHITCITPQGVMRCHVEYEVSSIDK